MHGMEYITRPAMFVKRNNGERSCNHCCSGKAMNIAQAECVYL